MVLNSVIFDVAKKKLTKNINIESEIFYIIASSLTFPVFNLKIHLVKIPEAAAP
jgi:hypothetical protein